MNTPKPTPDADYLGRLFEYRDGELYWRPGTGRKMDRPAGTRRKGGYVVVFIDYQRYYMHRIIWKLLTGTEPPPLLDHLDGDKHNNSIQNLRPSTSRINASNMRLSSANTSGVRGVSWVKSRELWRAQITVNYVNHNLGCFDTIEEAAAARRKAEREHNFWQRSA